MQAITNNIIGFSTGTVEEKINTFLNKLALKSERTKESYTQAIKRFFMWHCRKELNQLVVSDLQISNMRMVQYQLHLNNDFDYTNSTINQYTSAVISLYEFLSRDKDNNVRAEDVKLDMLPDDGECYGELYWREAETMAQLAVKQKKGHEKAALIRLAYRTSFRKSTLLSLELKDFKLNTESNCYVVTGLGKRKKKHERPISVELYNDLVAITKLKYYARYDDNQIFHMSDQGIRDMINTLKEEMGIGEERNIVFHSFRNAAAGYIAETGGTIEEIRDQLNRSYKFLFFRDISSYNYFSCSIVFLYPQTIFNWCIKTKGKYMTTHQIQSSNTIMIFANLSVGSISKTC